MPKALGIGFFEAAHKGAEEAAKELGDVEIIYTGPTDTTAEGQIEVLNALIAQGVDAIAVSANDTDALVPTLKKAMQRGIKVISWDSGVAPEGRQLHLNPSSSPLIGNMIIKLAADHLPDGGDVAVLSATATATNQNTWIEEMNKVKGNYPGINVVATVYGDDLADKSYRETQGLIQTYPEPQGDHRADLRRHRRRGAGGRPTPARSARSTSPASACPRRWPATSKFGAVAVLRDLEPDRPRLLGHDARLRPRQGRRGQAGRAALDGPHGQLTLDDNNEGAMADPFVYDKSNIEEFKSIF